MAIDEASIDALFSASLDEFTSRRNALAKELAGAGEKERAAEVKGLQKPSVPAWALNQLALTDASGVAELLDLADQLRAAQRGDGGDLRKLNAQVRAQVAKLLGEAQAIAEANGRAVTQSLKNLVTQSLMAAAAEEEAGAQLRAGRLSRELQPGGFDSASSDAYAWSPEPARSPRQKEAEERAAVLAEEADAAEAEANQLAKEAERAEREAARARARADEAAVAAGKKRARSDSAASTAEREAN
ncbi:MAG: hypothetical protein M3P01_08705 [Actinomycetota bacterium]|nr:hypothetical protein [Actinomycetota bacterium]